MTVSFLIVIRLHYKQLLTVSGNQLRITRKGSNEAVDCDIFKRHAEDFTADVSGDQLMV
jgi:hypothetical protein